MKPSIDVGILGYGCYVPINRLKAKEIARIWGNEGRLPLDEKAVVSLDEDTITISVEASRYALSRAMIDPKKLGAVYVGTESKPYAVKPSGTIVAAAIGASPNIMTADYEFACKAGTEAFQNCIGLIGSGMVDYALAIGVDTAQGRPADALEYTAGCGGAAFIFSKKSKETVAYVEASCSHVTDTPDFWRRAHEQYPRHAGRFTGEPSYYYQITSAAKALMNEVGTEPDDYDYAVFHQPNAYFPVRVGRSLGFPVEKIKQGLLTPMIGNTYAGSSPMGLASVLDVANPGDKIFMVSYGSGAGSDAFSIVVQPAIEDRRKLAPMTSTLIERKRNIDYAMYTRYRRKIMM